MPENDEQFEQYLRDFQPRTVRKLKLPRRAGNFWLRRFAAAAAVVFCVGGGYWHVRRTRVVMRVIHMKSTALLITRIGLGDSKKLDEFLDDQSRNVLPNFQGEHSTLRVLAKE
jgi:hypothetical protein